MAEHKCQKEDVLEEICETLKRIDEGLRGNGKPGLFTEFAVWKNMVLGLVGLNVIIVGYIIASRFGQ